MPLETLPSSSKPPKKSEEIPGTSPEEVARQTTSERDSQGWEQSDMFEQAEEEIQLEDDVSKQAEAVAEAVEKRMAAETKQPQEVQQEEGVAIDAQLEKAGEELKENLTELEKNIDALPEDAEAMPSERSIKILHRIANTLHALDALFATSGIGAIFTSGVLVAASSLESSILVGGALTAGVGVGSLAIAMLAIHPLTDKLLKKIDVMTKRREEANKNRPSSHYY